MSEDTSPLRALMSTTRFGKFASVGAVGAVCDTLILLFLVERIGLLEEIAVLIGIESSILIMFVINDNWTYSETDNIRTLSRRLLRSHTVRIVGALTQFIVFTIIYRSYFMQLEFSGIDLWLLVAKGSGIVLGMILNYTFETLFTWSIHKNI
jgi:putative flippase GtrA